MAKKILIPLDGSESIREVRLYAHSIASSRPDTRLILLHAEPAGSANHAPPSYVDQLQQMLADAGWKVESLMRHGDPVDVIHQVADEVEASLIVMSTHGRSGLERIREGSITESVLRESNCPVFILHSTHEKAVTPPPGNLFRRILVPLDGSEASSAILPCVQEFALMHGSEVVLFHDSRDDTPEQEAATGAEITRTRMALEEQGVELANTGVKVSIDWTSYRHPTREILHKIDQLHVDLVAMATHTGEQHRGPLESSVTAEVIRHAKCPLLVWSAAHCGMEGVP